MPTTFGSAAILEPHLLTISSATHLIRCFVSPLLLRHAATRKTGLTRRGFPGTMLAQLGRLEEAL